MLPRRTNTSDLDVLFDAFQRGAHRSYNSLSAGSKQVTSVGSERMTILLFCGATAPTEGVMREGMRDGIDAIVDVGEPLKKDGSPCCACAPR